MTVATGKQLAQKYEFARRSTTLPPLAAAGESPQSRTQTGAPAVTDRAPVPANPLPTFNPPRRVPHGITLVGRLFDDGLVGQVGLALERALGVSAEQPTGF